jgi:pimeloyl-ACP methyl ester carboxylesterase
MSDIKIPVLLIWGKNDQLTPIWQAEIMNKKITNSKLIIVSNGNHNLALLQPNTTAKIIGQFLNS